MNYGWARDDEAARIQALLAQDGLELTGGDWTGLAQTWLVARDDAGRVQGCIAVHHGRPIGRADFMSVDDRIAGHGRAKIVKGLIEMAMAALALRGATFATGQIDQNLSGFAEALVSYGGMKVSEGWLYIADLHGVLRKIKDGRHKVDDHHEGRDHPGRAGVH